MTPLTATLTIRNAHMREDVLNIAGESLNLKGAAGEILHSGTSL